MYACLITIACHTVMLYASVDCSVVRPEGDLLRVDCDAGVKAYCSETYSNYDNLLVTKSNCLEDKVVCNGQFPRVCHTRTEWQGIESQNWNIIACVENKMKGCRGDGCFERVRKRCQIIVESGGK